jgi:hypothetical protein
MSLYRLLPNLDVNKKILDFKKKCRTFYDEINFKEPPIKDTGLFKRKVNALINATKKEKVITTVSA